MELVLSVGLIVITALICIFIGSWGSVLVRESGTHCDNEVLTMIDVFTLPLNYVFTMTLISFLSEWDYHYLLISVLSCVLSSLIKNYFGKNAENRLDDQSKEKEFSIVSSKNNRLMVLTPWIKMATFFQYVLIVVISVSWYYSTSLGIQTLFTSILFILFKIADFSSIEKCLFLVATESKSSRKPISSIIALAVKSGHEDIKIVTWPKMIPVVLLILAYLLNSFHWILSNITAIFTAIIGITCRQFEDVKACLLVECIFIVLNVIAIFGTDWEMNAVQYLTVLTVKVPPKSFSYSAQSSFTDITLGLWGIILPGMFASLLFSYEKKYHSNKSPNLFFVGMIGYSFGIFIAFAMAHTFNAMQPALLYINPLLILFAALFSLYRGELKQLINFSLK